MRDGIMAEAIEQKSVETLESFDAWMLYVWLDRANLEFKGCLQHAAIGV